MKKTITIVTVIFSVRALARPKIPTPLRRILSIQKVTMKLEEITYITHWLINPLLLVEG